jgi:hypothetical protein
MGLNGDPGDLRLAILAHVNDAEAIREVVVPEWGITLRVRGLTAGERDRYELALREQKDRRVSRNIRGLLVALSVVDDDGKRVFKNADAVELSKLPAGPVDRLFEAAAELSGLTPKDQEELEKKSSDREDS